MNELITGLNGGNVPALDIIMLLTFAALIYAYYNRTFFYEKCNGSPADAA